LPLRRGLRYPAVPPRRVLSVALSIINDNCLAAWPVLYLLFWHEVCGLLIIGLGSGFGCVKSGRFYLF
ncbi:MAG: hypothetical protein ACRC0M_08200, partial [Legionella sp.]